MHFISAATLAGATLAAATPSPSPSPAAFNPDLVTPGILGFLAILFVAVVTVFLALDMNRRIRRTRYRAQLREEAEAAAKAGPKKGNRSR